jgi:hypothetical protein
VLKRRVRIVIAARDGVYFIVSEMYGWCVYAVFMSD